MTQEDQYAIIGKAHVDYRETKRELEAINARGRQMAEIANNLANALGRPERIVIAEPNTQLIAGRDAVIFVEGSFQQIAIESVRKHVEEYKAATKKLQALRQQLINLGEADPQAR